MKVITCISDCKNTGYNTLLKRSCNILGYDLVTLLTTEPWTSHRQKDAVLIECLKSMGPDEIVFFADGYDTLFVKEPSEVLKKFKSFDADILFSAEINCWPYMGLNQIYRLVDSSATYFPYLNSGGFIGKAKNVISALQTDFDYCIKNLYEHHNLSSLNPGEKFKWSNQYIWTCLYLSKRQNIVLDHECSIFQTLSTPYKYLRSALARINTRTNRKDVYREEFQRICNYLHFNNGKSYNVLTMQNPCHIHFNGPIPKHLVLNGYFDEILPQLLE